MVGWNWACSSISESVFGVLPVFLAGVLAGVLAAALAGGEGLDLRVCLWRS